MSGGHVFFSYSHKDAEHVRRLVAHTRKLGFDVFWDGDLEVGGRWSREIHDKIRSCSAFVLVMTENAEQSERVENELLLAEKCDDVTFVPLHVDNHIFDYLQSRQGISVEAGALPGPGFTYALEAAGAGRGDSPTNDDTGEDGPPAPTQPVDFGTNADIAKYVTTPKSERAAALVGESRSLAQKMRFPDALDKLEEALAADPDFVPALISRAWIRGSQNDFSGALADADRATVLDPDQPLAHGNRALALAAMKRLPEARTAIERTIALEPDSVTNHWTHGGILLNLGEFALAEKAYDRALEISPDIKQLQLARRMAIARKWAAKAGIGRRRR